MPVHASARDSEKRRILIRRIHELPTISSTLTRLMEIVGSEKSCAKDLAKLIEQDLALLSALLKLVNSAFYGHRREITSLHQATVILGFNTIRNVALGVSIFKARRKKTGLILRRDALWRHSLGAASAAKTTARIAGYKDPEQAFVAGLLHDTGKVIFDELFPDDFMKVLKTVQHAKCAMSDAETQIMDMDHGEAGFILLDQWNLPSSILDAVRRHHDPGASPEQFRALTSITYLANIVAKRLEIGSGGEALLPDPDPRFTDVLSLDKTGLDQILEETKAKKEAIQAFQLT